MEPAGTRRWNRRPSAPLKGHSRRQGVSAKPEPEKASREQGLGHVHLAGETSHVAGAGLEPASEISRGEVQEAGELGALAKLPPQGLLRDVEHLHGLPSIPTGGFESRCEISRSLLSRRGRGRG
jgi:hypothetical protein